MEVVKLEDLSWASAQVQCKPFGAVNVGKREKYLLALYKRLVELNLKADPDEIIDAVEEALDQTKVLMIRGVEQHVKRVANELVDHRNTSGGRPIFPIMNEEWKSDAWLTGLVVKELADRGVLLNPGNVGYAFRAKAGPMKMIDPVQEGNYELVLI